MEEKSKVKMANDDDDRKYKQGMTLNLGRKESNMEQEIRSGRQNKT